MTLDIRTEHLLSVARAAAEEMTKPEPDERTLVKYRATATPERIIDLIRRFQFARVHAEAEPEALLSDTKPEALLVVAMRDISLEQEHAYSDVRSAGTMGRVITGTVWTARLDHRPSTGPRVEMTSFGNTSKEALDSLVASIRAEGWEVKP